MYIYIYTNHTDKRLKLILGKEDRLIQRLKRLGWTLLPLGQ